MAQQKSAGASTLLVLLGLILLVLALTGNAGNILRAIVDWLSKQKTAVDYVKNTKTDTTGQNSQTDTKPNPVPKPNPAAQTAPAPQTTFEQRASDYFKAHPDATTWVDPVTHKIAFNSKASMPWYGGGGASGSGVGAALRAILERVGLLAIG